MLESNGWNRNATADQLGMKGLDCGAWGAFSFPKGTPQEIVRNPAVLECYLGEETEV